MGNSPTRDFFYFSSFLSIIGKCGRKELIKVSDENTCYQLLCFQASLASLLGALEKASPYFVRCLQPNNRKVSCLVTKINCVFCQTFLAGVYAYTSNNLI